MTAKIFDDILLKGIRSGKMPAREAESRIWYRDQAKKIAKINETSFMKGGGDRLTTRLIPGRMYMYYYDPKGKKTLPYYDRFPLVFPYAKTPQGWMGLNLHYLPPPLRAKLMDALYDFVSDNKYDEKTKLKFSYGMLKEAAKYKAFAPCLKMYLKDHLRSRFLTIHPTEWDIALFLKTERFEKASKTEVWKDSRKIIRGK